MRLTDFEKEAIIKTAKKHFRDFELYLFGSRIDDSKKGGDIDLYFKLSKKPDMMQKVKFLVELKNIIGEQKIDVVIYYPSKKLRDIDIEAQKGIRLC